MYEHVILKYVGGGEGFSTVLADIGSFVSVRPLVLHPRTVVRKAASTVLAGKRTLSRVLAHVALQLGTGAESITTDAVQSGHI